VHAIVEPLGRPSLRKDNDLPKFGIGNLRFEKIRGGVQSSRPGLAASFDENPGISLSLPPRQAGFVPG
jgi:hypothetical protein